MEEVRGGERRANGPASDDGEPAPSGLSRRTFIKSVGVSAAASSIATAAGYAREQPVGSDDRPIVGPGPVPISLTVNGTKLQLSAEPAATLLDVLRLQLNLTGSKEICDRGSCGGCSVLVDGKLVNSCMMLAFDASGSDVTTVEGMAKGNELDPVQHCLIKHDGLQCGYCTPGFVVASRALLSENPKPTLAQIKHGLSGNICRCGTYTNIFNAVLEASGQSPVMDQKGA